MSACNSETSQHRIPRLPQSIGKCPSALNFLHEPNLGKIIPILEKRLPKSAHIYNMCKMYDNCNKPEEVSFYVMCSNPMKGADILGEALDDDVWVLGIYLRHDYGKRYVISAPPNAITSSDIKDAFVKCPYIKWDEAYHFTCIDFEISPMIHEISTQVIGNSVTSMPCKIYFMSTNKAANLNIPADTLPNNLVLQPLDTVKGTEFICKTWKYAIEKTGVAVQKILSRNKSVGLYDEPTKKVICGLCIHDCGLLGMLHTLPEERGKGYASLVVKCLLKSLGEDLGAVPASAVEIKNHTSAAFHEKLGMSVSHYADFIKYVPQSW